MTHALAKLICTTLVRRLVAVLAMAILVASLGSLTVWAQSPYPVHWGPEYQASEVRIIEDFARGRNAFYFKVDDSWGAGVIKHYDDATSRSRWELNTSGYAPVSGLLPDFDVTDRWDLKVGLVDGGETGLDVARINWRGIEPIPLPGDQLFPRVEIAEPDGEGSFRLDSWFDVDSSTFHIESDTGRYMTLRVRGVPADAELVCFPGGAQADCWLAYVVEDGVRLFLFNVTLRGTPMHDSDGQRSHFFYPAANVYRIWSLSFAREIWYRHQINPYGERAFLSMLVETRDGVEQQLIEVRRDWRRDGIERGWTFQWSGLSGLGDRLTETTEIHCGCDGFRTDGRLAWPNEFALICGLSDDEVTQFFRVITIQRSPFDPR